MILRLLSLFLAIMVGCSSPVMAQEVEQDELRVRPMLVTNSYQGRQSVPLYLERYEEYLAQQNQPYHVDKPHVGKLETCFIVAGTIVLEVSAILLSQYLRSVWGG